MSFDTQWLDWATALQDRQNRLFWDEKGGAYFTTSGKDPNLLLKTKGDFDGAEPSPNSVSALNLTRLSWFFDNKDWARMAEKTIKCLPGPVVAIAVFSTTDACSSRCIGVFTETSCYRR